MGVYKSTKENCDKKFQNLKSTYKSVKDKINKCTTTFLKIFTKAAMLWAYSLCCLFTCAFYYKQTKHTRKRKKDCCIWHVWFVHGIMHNYEEVILQEK